MDSRHSINSASRDLNQHLAEIYPLSEGKTIQMRRYYLAFLAVLILHLAVFFSLHSLLDAPRVSIESLKNIELMQVELVPERYAEVNPEALANRPDQSAFYSFQNQQASDLSPEKDGSAKPLIDGTVQDATKIVSGKLSSEKLTQPQESGLYRKLSKGMIDEMTEPKSATQAEGADRSATQAASFANSIGDLHPFEPVASAEGVDSVQQSLLDSPETETSGIELLPLTLATAEALSEAALSREGTDAPSVLDRPLPMVRPKLSSELTIGPIARTQASANRLGVIAMDASLSEFGEYEKQFYSAIQNGWYNEIAYHQPIESSSRVTVSFVLHSNGTINGLSVLSSTAGAMATRICESAIVRRSPFRAWTREMVEVYGLSRELTLRFYYR